MNPRLVVVTGFSERDEAESFARIERACRSARPGEVVVQLRDHELTAKRRFALGRRLLEIARRHGQLVAVNDRIDLYLALGADALHLGEASVSPEEARKLVGEGTFLFRACHRPEDAEPQGEDAVVLSPIVEPRHGRSALGLLALDAAKARAGGSLVYALGGVSARNATSLLAAGASGVVVMGAILDHDDPLPLLAALEIAR